MPILDSERMVDWIAPDYVEEERITLSLDEGEEPKADHSLTVNVDYTAAGEHGVMLPLELIVQPCFGEGGASLGYLRKVFRRLVPSSYMVTPPSSGRYLVVLREMFHNQFFGRLFVDVAGDAVFQIPLTRRQ
jgi:hypothetical protein